MRSLGDLSCQRKVLPPQPPPDQFAAAMPRPNPRIVPTGALACRLVASSCQSMLPPTGGCRRSRQNASRRRWPWTGPARTV